MGLVLGRDRVGTPAQPPAAEAVEVLDDRRPSLKIAVQIQAGDPELGSSRITFVDSHSEISATAWSTPREWR